MITILQSFTDVKPENILLDRFGHLKLADFGSAIALSDDGSFISISPVGTPDYIAPELLRILDPKGNQKHHKLDVSFMIPLNFNFLHNWQIFLNFLFKL